ncbi:MAG: RNA polymerase factor sigma-70 [Planctomycetota bacterium]|nr:MAG: RNA polymerase factor sigma-70 [Planctomycetota bacterium]REJ88142.1 MAG: RNA polymerase factor sigma-70 [Planctomycetota bacterium]REK27396.1 MAG: RNA polymerase factor sigma-70 [Planctomycetota bacterium]REK36581.1 MAG: RNA polymerase factor sigma-70 [Planctomycetota bacterium]
MWPDAEKTQELIDGAAAGDEDAANRLLERHRESLRRMIALRLDRAIRGRVDASDVVQDVMLEANRRLAEYLRDPPMPFHLWMRHLAKDRMIDLHRRHHAQRRDVARDQPLRSRPYSDRSSLDLAGQLKDAELTPAAATIRKELAERFFDAVATLDETDREIILMRHVEHLGNGETAEALGLSPAAAGMRYLRALRRLRAILSDPPSTH